MVVPVVVGLIVGTFAYGLSVAVEAAVRAFRARESTRIITGLGCEPQPELGRSARQPVTTCWCGGVLTGQRTARFPATVRMWCSECGRWSDIKETS